MLPRSAAARHVLDLDLAHQPAALADWGDYLIDPGGELTVRQVLSYKDRFAPTLTGGRAYPLRDGQALWIRIAVPATVDQQRWYIKVASPGVDLVSLYTLGPDETWSRIAAGDMLPVGSWPIPHPHPVLPLAVSPSEPTYYLLRIQSSDGFAAPIEFISETQLAQEQQRLSLGFGVYLGLLAMAAVFAFATGVALRDVAYIWFALWAGMAALAATAVTGLAGVHLWPDDARWNDAAKYVLPMLAVPPFLLFVEAAILLRDRARLFFRATVVLAVTGTAGAVLCFWLEDAPRLMFALAVGATIVLAACASAAWTWWRGDRFSGLLLLALSPLLAALIWQGAYLLAWLPHSAYAAHVIMLAAGLTVSACYMLLAVRSHDKRDQLRRVARLAEIDPTTGLVNQAVFLRRVSETIARGRRFDHQSAAAIVEFANLAELQHEFGREKTAAMLLRLADRLGSMMRTVDTVARCGDARFGLLVEGPLSASRARSFSAKVIANCIMPLSGLPQGLMVRPRVVLVLVPFESLEAGAVFRRLQDMLAEAASDPTRSIFIEGHPNGTPKPGAPGGGNPRNTEWQQTSASADDADAEPAGF